MAFKRQNSASTQITWLRINTASASTVSQLKISDPLVCVCVYYDVCVLFLCGRVCFPKVTSGHSNAVCLCI